jgi:hypothetical protein
VSFADSCLSSSMPEDSLHLCGAIIKGRLLTFGDVNVLTPLIVNARTRIMYVIWGFDGTYFTQLLRLISPNASPRSVPNISYSSLPGARPKHSATAQQQHNAKIKCLFPGVISRLSPIQGILSVPHFALPFASLLTTQDPEMVGVPHPTMQPIPS